MGTNPSRTRLASSSAEPRLTLYFLMLANMVLPSVGVSGNRCHCLSARPCSIARQFLTEKQRIRNADSWESAGRVRRHPPDLSDLGGRHGARRQHRLRRCDLDGVQSRWTADTTTGTAGRQCSASALAQKLDLELPKGSEDVEGQPPGRAGGVERLIKPLRLCRPNLRLLERMRVGESASIRPFASQSNLFRARRGVWRPRSLERR